MDLKHYIREIPNWPQKGISFKDITPLLADPKAFQTAINSLAKPFLKKKIDRIVGIDARGFILAAALAYKLKTGLAIIRKKGKLPYKTLAQKYQLEYAASTLEIHIDAIKRGEKVLIVDDVLATGGTMAATTKLVKRLGGKILGIAFLAELSFLNGRKKFAKYPFLTLIKY